MSVPLRVLILEDRATDAELMLHELRRAGFSPDWKLVETEAEYLAHLEPAPDVILADYSLPQFDAQRALELLQSRGLDIPFLIVSGNIGEEIAVSAMRRGADDYVLKDRLARLGQAVSNALALRRQRQEKQQAEATLRERDDRFRAPFQQAAVGMALVGLDGRWLMVNQSLCDSLGYSRPELSTRTCKENIHPDDLSADQGSMTLLLAGDIQSDSLEQRFLRRDGTYIWCKVTRSLLRNFSGRPESFITVVEDIHEHKRANDALRESEERYRLLFETNPHAMWVYDAETLSLLAVNDAATRHYGYSRPEFLGMTVKELRPQNDLAALLYNIAPSSSDFDVSGDWRHQQKDGSMIDVEISSQLVRFGAREARLVIANDITERKLAEEEEARLHASIERSALEWQLTFDAIETPVLILDLDGRIARLNRAAKELAGRSEEELTASTLESLGSYSLWQKAAELINSIRASGAAASCRAHDQVTGRSWDLAATLTAAPEGDGERMILVIAETTHVVELQASLHRSETMSLLGSIVSGVAHEVRNPLFGITSTIDAFEARVGDNATYHRYTSVLRGEVNRLNGLMKDLLEYGKPLSRELQKGSLGDVIKTAVYACTALAKRSQVEIDNRIDGGLAPILLDAKRLPQVFLNLIENAIQHSKVGGTVTVDAQTVIESLQIWIVCTVRDSGPGFQEADLKHIFEPFFTRRRGGTGLGLSIVQKIVEEHEGTISAENAPEGGAVMVVKFPAAAADGEIVFAEAAER